MNINLVELDLASLQQLQGGQVFNQVSKLIASAVADCENRPAEERERVIVLKLSIRPESSVQEIDENTTRRVIDSLKLKLDMDLKCPTRRTIEFDCGLGEDHKLLFNPHSPHNHRQQPLPLVLDGEVTTVKMPSAG